MRIRSLTMKDFRGFADATVDLDRPLTVLCGVNGSGKSSVLMACVLVLSEVLRNAHVDEGIWSHTPEDNDIRRDAHMLSLVATLSNGDITQETAVRHSPGPKHSPPGI